MPLPKPGKKEKQDDFIGRCMSAIKDEFPDKDQRLAVCFKQWKEKEKDSVDLDNLESSQAPPSQYEMRFLTNCQIRALDTQEPILEGYAAVFDLLSEDMGGFREKIKSGAFQESIQKDDIRLLWNHDANFVLARTKSGTLELREDAKGLWFRGTLPNTDLVHHFVTSVKRRDVSETSFGFILPDRLRDQEWNKERTVRTITKAKLFDVSPVAYPAYPQTNTQARADRKNFWFFDNGIYSAGEPDPTIMILPQGTEERTEVDDDGSKGQTVTPDPTKALFDLDKWSRVSAIKEKRRIQK